jgi:hypothetical protein
MSKDIKIGTTVKHRRQNYPIGKVEKIEEGCNAIYWVDFNQTICGKKHLTVCCSLDIDAV